MKIVSKDIVVQISFMGRNLELTFCLSETIILPAKIELETNHAVYLKIKQAFFIVCFMFVVVVVVVFFSQENVIVPWFPNNIYCIYFFLLNPCMAYTCYISLFP